MKKFYLITIGLLLFISNTYSQISISRLSGGSVVTKLGMGISINNGSSLTREWIVLNDTTCPLQLQNVGINTVYLSSEYYFKASGILSLKEKIVAYEIHHVLYNVFGEHIKTLKNLEVIDISMPTELPKMNSWYATENDVSEYLTCVSYVATVRTLMGKIWYYKPELIKQELNKVQIAYEEGYSPSTNTDQK
jgi:hypothetical protein